MENSVTLYCREFTKDARASYLASIMLWLFVRSTSSRSITAILAQRHFLYQQKEKEKQPNLEILNNLIEISTFPYDKLSAIDHTTFPPLSQKSVLLHLLETWKSSIGLSLPIFAEGPCKLPCKIWRLQLEKLLSYAHFRIYS